MSTISLYFILTKSTYRLFQKKDLHSFPLCRKDYIVVDNSVENVYNFL